MDDLSRILLQFAILGSHPLLILAAGYPFTALVMVPHALSVPRLSVEFDARLTLAALARTRRA